MASCVCGGGGVGEGVRSARGPIAGIGPDKLATQQGPSRKLLNIQDQSNWSLDDQLSVQYIAYRAERHYLCEGWSRDV